MVVCCGNCGAFVGKTGGRGHRNAVGGTKFDVPAIAVVVRFRVVLQVCPSCGLLHMFDPLFKGTRCSAQKLYRGWDQTMHATAYVCDVPGSLPLLVRVGFHCRSGVVPFVPPARSLSLPKPRPRSLCWECRPCPSSPCPLVWALWPLSLLRLASTELGPHVVSSCIGCGGAAAGGSHGTVSWRSSTSSRRMGSPRSLWSSFVVSC